MPPWSQQERRRLLTSWPTPQCLKHIWWDIWCDEGALLSLKPLPPGGLGTYWASRWILRRLGSLGNICFTVRCLNVEEAVFKVSDNVVFSTSSSSFKPWAIRAVQAIVSLREGWSNHQTWSVTSLSPRSNNDALGTLRVLAGLTLNDPLEVVTACLNSWYCATEIFFSPSSSLLP